MGEKGGKIKGGKEGGGDYVRKKIGFMGGRLTTHVHLLRCCMVNSNKNSVKGAKSVPGSSSAPCQGADQQRNLRQTRSQIQLLTSDMFNCGIADFIEGGGAN